MSSSFVGKEELPDFALWEKLKKRRAPVAFDLELTARCNNECWHCYIGLPAKDSRARGRELTVGEIHHIADEAVHMGAVWCLLTGGEPLLRDDFAEIYVLLKRLGLLVSVFTNACLVTPEHVELFRRYPPRDIEVTMYGATEETYERVTRRSGSFRAFERGLELVLNGGVKVSLKAMAMRSNVHELPEIARFCREHTKDYYRFDPMLHLRFDRDEKRNAEIRAERLSPEEIVEIERADAERFGALQKGCEKLIISDAEQVVCDHLFHCGAGRNSFVVAYDGKFRLCSSLWHPDSIYDLRKGTLAEAWSFVVPRVRDMRSQRPEFLEKCRKCAIINLCLWCPAHAYLETGEMDAWVPYFCEVAHARAQAIATQDSRPKTQDRTHAAENERGHGTY